MSNEIYATYDSGNTLYALIRRRPDDYVYDVVAGSDTFEAFNAANIGNYDLPMTDDGGDYYSVDFPAGISENQHTTTVYLQLAGSPAVNDLPIYHGEIEWDGTQEITRKILDDKLDGLTGSAFKNTNVYGPGE
jgi:hypothetical protein